MLANSHEWRHIQISARRHARERSERMAVVAMAVVATERSGRWHYTIVPAESAERWRRLAGRYDG